VVHMTRAFLPLLGKGQEARIVNVSSIYGVIAPPAQTAYASSKFAVRGFTHALRHELKDTAIGVTVVHPGGVATEIANSARMHGNFTPEEIEERRAFVNRNLKMPPAKAGEIIVSGIERGKGRIFVGTDAKFISIVERIAPVGYWNLLSRMFARR
jgi:short-subunit dehydrogenase